MNAMNVFHREPIPSSLEERNLRGALEQAGWRFTRQRAAVFACLRATQGHPTAEQVFAAVRQHLPHISLATVYKALEALVDARVANRISGDTGPTRYDGRSEPHYHLRCQCTDQVMDLPLPYDPDLLDKLDPQLVDSLRQQGFEITGHRLELVGRFVSREME
jgi:Fur family transcriptional regulator, peroxide stress response regulator